MKPVHGLFDVRKRERVLAQCPASVFSLCINSGGLFQLLRLLQPTNGRADVSRNEARHLANEILLPLQYLVSAVLRLNVRCFGCEFR